MTWVATRGFSGFFRKSPEFANQGVGPSFFRTKGVRRCTLWRGGLGFLAKRASDPNGTWNSGFEMKIGEAHGRLAVVQAPRVGFRAEIEALAALEPPSKLIDSRSLQAEFPAQDVELRQVYLGLLGVGGFEAGEFGRDAPDDRRPRIDEACVDLNKIRAGLDFPAGVRGSHHAA